MRGPAAPGTRIPLMIHLINLKSDNNRILSKCRQIQGDQSWQIQGDQSSELLKGKTISSTTQKPEKTKKNEKSNLIE